MNKAAIFTVVILFIMCVASFTYTTFTVFAPGIVSKESHGFYIPSFGIIKNIPPVPPQGDNSSTSPTTLLFMGDIMLGRHVEYLMLKNSINYPFSGLSLNDESNTYVFANFEGSIPKVHQKTPNFGFLFSVAKDNTISLAAQGFTHFSLANNHSLDFGAEGYSHTTSTLASNGITAFGHPTQLNESSVTYLTTATDQTVAVIALHTLFGTYDREELEFFISSVSEKSDIQIIFIHWGEEYVMMASNAQRSLATELSRLGADVIIGHHPHVVQPVEMIDDTIVFYSLGNYIFDQYFSSNVQNGLMLSMLIEPENLSIRLLPVTSEFSPAQPHKMSELATSKFLADLASRSDVQLSQSIGDGLIYFALPLATSTEIAIME